MAGNKKPANNNHVQRTINELIQLQELVVARAQKKASKPKVRFKELDHSIAAMTDDLPDGLRTHFENLLKKDPVAIVPTYQGKCSGCGMELPVSLANSVHAAKQLYRCPTCTRILYHRTVQPKGVPVRRKRFAPAQKGVERFSSDALMLPKLTGDTPEAVLRQLCSRMAEEGFVEDGDLLLEKALEREAVMSTAVEHGMAFPHVRGVEGGGLTLAVGIHRKGLRFNPDARRLTRIFFFMAIPTAASAFYLKLLAGISKALTSKETRERLIAAKTPEELWTAVQKATRKHIS
jgi:PTS system nitrogen regulatory IIA component